MNGNLWRLNIRARASDPLAAFTKWLAEHPVPGDRVYGAMSVRYQVTRYCEYLQSNPWPGGDPLCDSRARDGAVNAYGAYLETFNVPDTTIDVIRTSLDHFYVFLGLGTARYAVG